MKMELEIFLMFEMWDHQICAHLKFAIWSVICDVVMDKKYIYLGGKTNGKIGLKFKVPHAYSDYNFYNFSALV